MRKFLILILVILLLIIIIPGVINSYARIEPEKPDRYTLHFVKPGDCFWKLAVNYMPKVDPRQGVRWIKEANGLGDEPEYIMQPGDCLNVPCDTGELDEPWGQD